MPLYHLIYPLLLILQPLLTLSCLADNYIITQNLSQTLNTLKSFETESSEPVSSNSIPLEPINSSDSAMKFKMTFDSEIHQSGSKSQMHFILPVFGLNTKPSKNYSNEFVMDVLEKINSDSNLFLSKHLNYTIYEHSVKNENVNKKNNTNVINVFNKNVTINVNNNVNVDYNYVQSICNNCLILRGMKKYRKYRDRAYGFKSSLESDILTGSVAEGDWSKVITILGLFELTTQGGERPEGRSELAAAMLATKDINQRKLLGDYRLQILANDTKCDPGVGVDSFFHALYTHTHTKMPMLLGSACSEVTESLAKITPYWNMVQVSFGSTAPALSDRREFPLFYRTAAPDSSHNPARLAFITRFGWETVTALSQNEDVYSLAVNDLVTKLEQANITCRATITFAENDFMEQLKMLKELDTRIIIGSFSHEVAPKIFCEAYKLGMYGSDYVWILQGNPRDLWWQNQTQCIQKQLSAAVEGLIVVSTHNAIVGNKPSISGLTNNKFISLLPTPLSPFVHQTYDAVWAIALALKETNANFSCYHYANKDMARKFFSQLGNLHFLGVSGPVAFNGADRVGITAFYQIQDGAVRNVALFDPTTDLLDFNCEDCTYIVWQGHQVPIAKRVFKLKVITIQPMAFLTIACLASVGITLAISFLAFNLYFRRLKYIKLSSPRLNNIAVVGSILVYMAVILLGLDHATLPSKSAFPTVCTARVYLLSAGFSLAFGSMFTKTYRVHRIFTRSTSSVVKNKLLQDTQLISLICMLLLIDGLIVTLWVSIDPMQRQLRNLSLEISSTDRSVVYQPQVEVCGSQFTHSWLGVLYAYKGLLLIVGVYMAWETRHVKIPALNDSQYIGMSVYSVVITSVLVVVLANLISERATLAFLTITILILISTTSSLCLLFLPKIHAIVAHKDSTTDPIMHSMGLKIEFNTRRFLMDDRREVYYRVEVQNRVYHREILSLDNEISRLEKALVSDPSTASSSHSSVASRKGEMTPLDEAIDRLHKAPPGRGKSPSVGGGIPMLLLSVLPPVIPRASWPSAEHCVKPSHGVTFNSEPKLDDNSVQQTPNVRYQMKEISKESLNENTGRLTVLGRLLNMLGTKPSSRKTSSVSYSGGNVGIAAALKVHMGYFAGLVPGKSNSVSLESCNTHRKNDEEQEESLSRKGDDHSDEDTQTRSVQSLSHRVSFSIQHQHSQPILTFKEKVKGSPRFPHRIVPTCSLNALEERIKSNSCGNNIDSFRRKSQIQMTLKQVTAAQRNDSGVEKCRSLEDASNVLSTGSEHHLSRIYDATPVATNTGFN